MKGPASHLTWRTTTWQRALLCQGSQAGRRVTGITVPALHTCFEGHLPASKSGALVWCAWTVSPGTDKRLGTPPQMSMQAANTSWTLDKNAEKGPCCWHLKYLSLVWMCSYKPQALWGLLPNAELKLSSLLRQDWKSWSSWAARFWATEEKAVTENVFPPTSRTQVRMEATGK